MSRDWYLAGKRNQFVRLDLFGLDVDWAMIKTCRNFQLVMPYLLFASFGVFHEFSLMSHANDDDCFDSFGFLLFTHVSLHRSRPPTRIRKKTSCFKMKKEKRRVKRKILSKNLLMFPLQILAVSSVPLLRKRSLPRKLNRILIFFF